MPRRKRTITRVPYTGFSPQATVYRPPGQGYTPTISTTTGQDLEDQPSFLDSLNSSVQTYKGVKDAYAGGQKLGKKMEGWGDTIGEWWNSPDGITDIRQSRAAGLLNPTAPTPGATASPWYGNELPTGVDMGIWNDPQPQQIFNRSNIPTNPNLSNTPFPQSPDTVMNPHWANTATGPGYSGLNAGGTPGNPANFQFGPSQAQSLSRGSNLAMGDTSLGSLLGRAKNATSSALGIGGQTAIPGTYSAMSGGANLGNATQAGTEAIARTGMSAPAGTQLQAASTGSKALGAAGSALGVGMNVADMFDQGVTFGNMTGALGSAALGYGALATGAANAWNPVGWALLGASAADAIFDIF